MWLEQLWNEKLGGISKKQLWGKILLCFVGNFVACIGCAFFIDSQLGSDPISVFLDGLTATFGVSLGTASAIYTYGTLAVALLFAFKYLNLGTIISSVVWANVLGWADIVIRATWGNEIDLTTKVLFLVIGVIVMPAGLALSVSARFGFGSMDSILFRISDKIPKLNYGNLKMIADGTWIVIGFLMGGIVGVGSIVGFLFTGPLISFFVKLYNKFILGIFDLKDPMNEKV